MAGEARLLAFLHHGNVSTAALGRLFILNQEPVIPPFSQHRKNIRSFAQGGLVSIGIEVGGMDREPLLLGMQQQDRRSISMNVGERFRQFQQPGGGPQRAPAKPAEGPGQPIGLGDNGRRPAVRKVGPEHHQ